MSLDVWPPISGPDLASAWAATQERELEWIVAETLSVCQDLKHGLDDCYALLAPIDPGSTLVMSTPRNEKIKGTITRVGTRIVKASLNLQLRTLPPQALGLAPDRSVHIKTLDDLHANLTHAVDLLAALLSSTPTPQVLADAMTALATALSASAALLKGPPLSAPDPTWQASSVPSSLLAPGPEPTTMSVYVCVQECCVVVWIRALEAANVPVHFGTKLGLALGTFRRLEHDEMDKVFKYTRREGSGGAGEAADVYVREKVRVESADPSLISLYSKLGFMSHVLGQARRNLAAVMGVDLD